MGKKVVDEVYIPLRYNGSMSATLTPQDVQHIAKLANLIISDDQYALFASQLTAILAFVSKLQKVPTKGVEATAQVTGLVNVYREDVVDESRMLTQAQALSNAKKTHNGYFVVPAVLE